MELTLPNIETLEKTDAYGKFVVEPLERGYGVTLGNTLRRVLLSSIPGAAITYVKIDKVLHEFSTIPGVKEDTTELLLNLKNLAVKVHTNGAGKPDPKTISIDVKGSKAGSRVTGADVRCPADVEVVNPEAYLATISDEDATLSMEMVVEIGKGYVLPDKLERRSQQGIGTIPIGAAFTPVKKVNYTVEQTRVQSNTSYERLVIEVWTNGTISPEASLAEAAKVMTRFMELFVQFRSEGGLKIEAPVVGETTENPPYYRIEELDFSVRTYNCLKKANILTIGELIQYSETDLMQIRNFGKKSLTEVREKLTALNLSLKGGMTVDLSDSESDDSED